MIRRVVLAVAILALAAVSVSAAQAPGINSADIICILAGPAFVAVMIWPKRDRQAKR